MAPPNPPGGQPKPAYRTVYGDRLHAVRAAGWLEPAAWSEHRADEGPVEFDHGEQHAGDRTGRPLCLIRHDAPCRDRVLRCHDRPSVRVRDSDPRRRSKRSSTASSSAARCSLRADAAGGLARTTSRLPRGIASRRARMRCLSLRRTRFLTTAPPTALLTTKPTSGGTSASRVFRCATSVGRPARLPRRIASANSSLRRIRDADGSTRTSPMYGCRPSLPDRSRLPGPAGGLASSDRQLRAALAAAGGQDRTAGPGAHAQPEAVGLRAATVVRLVSTLAHGWAPGFSYVHGGHRERATFQGCGSSGARACEKAVA